MGRREEGEGRVSLVETNSQTYEVEAVEGFSQKRSDRSHRNITS